MVRLSWVALAAGGCLYPMQVQQNRISLSDPYAAVRVDIPSGQIEVTGWSGENTEVMSWSRWTGHAPVLDITVVGSELRVTVDCGNALDFCSVDLELHVPHTVGATLHSGVGDLGATELDGPVDAKTTAGSILMAHLGGPVKAETSAGSIIGTHLESSAVIAKTTLGSVDLAFAERPEQIDVDVGAGSIDLLVPSGAYDLRTRLVGQSVSSGITSQPDAPVLDLSTGLGSIRVRGVVVPETEPTVLAIPADSAGLAVPAPPSPPASPPAFGG